MNINDIQHKNTTNKLTLIQKTAAESKKHQFYSGLLTGIIDSSLSSYPVLLKSQIQANKVPTNKVGENRYIIGFGLSNSIGYTISSEILSAALSTANELIMRPGITGSRIKAASIPFIFCREASFWQGVNLNKEQTNESNSSPIRALACQAVFGGAIANIFDTLVGYSNAREKGFKETCNWAIKQPFEFSYVFKHSLPIRMFGCVCTPFIAVQLINSPHSPIKKWLDK